MAVPISVAVVNYNSSKFVENALYALEQLTSRDFEFLVCDNGSQIFDKWRLRQLANERNHVHVFWREQEESSSEAHATALNRLVEEMSGTYGVFLDADATFLKAGWDDILIEQITDIVKVIGTPPVENPTKPTDFPSVYATLFELKSFRELEVDMMPSDPNIGKDTGWEMRTKFLEAGFDGMNLEARNTRTYQDGPFGDILCTEYYLAESEQIIASHFGRGSSLGAAKYFKNTVFDLPKVGYVLGYLPSKIKGYQEKNHWLSVCRRIIDDQ